MPRSVIPAARDELTESEYPVGRVEALTGIASATLRVWERRYGRPVAHRRPSGHRRYDRDQVRWLRRVAEALACGHRPSRVVPMTDSDLETLLRPRRARPDDAELGAWLALVRSCRSDLLAEALGAALAAADARGQLCSWLDGRLAALLHRIGQEWTEGGLDIRHEHLASAVVEDVLRAARAGVVARAAGRGGVAAAGRPLLLANLPGERHRLGLRMAELAAASAGVSSTVLADVPLEEIVAAASDTGASVVGLGTSLGPAGTKAARLLVALRAALPERVALVVGGSGARLRRLPGVSVVTSLEDFRRGLPGHLGVRARDAGA